MKKLFSLILLILLFGPGFFTVFNVSANDYTEPEQPDYILAKYVIGSGGITGTTGAQNSLFATAGETCIDKSMGPNNTLLSGYWHKSAFDSPNVGLDEISSAYEAVELHQNYPNPFSSETAINYRLPYPCEVTIELFNHFGQKILVLLYQQIQGPGDMEIVWNGCNDQGTPVASGIYLYRITVSKTAPGNQGNGMLFQQTQKMSVVR